MRIAVNFPAFAQRVTVLGFTWKRCATSFGVNRTSASGMRFIVTPSMWPVRFGPYWDEVLPVIQREAIPMRPAHKPELTASGTLNVDIQRRPSFHLKRQDLQLIL